MLELGIISPVRTFKYCEVGQYITSSISHKIVADENKKEELYTILRLECKNRTEEVSQEKKDLHF